MSFVGAGIVTFVIVVLLGFVEVLIRRWALRWQAYKKDRWDDSEYMGRD